MLSDEDRRLLDQVEISIRELDKQRELLQSQQFKRYKVTFSNGMYVFSVVTSPEAAIRDVAAHWNVDPSTLRVEVSE